MYNTSVTSRAARQLDWALPTYTIYNVETALPSEGLRVLEST